MTILVLGGAGYIGSHTVYELIDNGEDVVIIDNLLTGHKEAIHPKARFYKGDIRDREFLDDVFQKEKIDLISMNIVKISNFKIYKQLKMVKQ